jgi:hypothetical protein
MKSVKSEILNYATADDRPKRRPFKVFGVLSCTALIVSMGLFIIMLFRKFDIDLFTLGTIGFSIFGFLLGIVGICLNRRNALAQVGTIGNAIVFLLCTGFVGIMVFTAIGGP